LISSFLSILHPYIESIHTIVLLINLHHLCLRKLLLILLCVLKLHHLLVAHILHLISLIVHAASNTWLLKLVQLSWCDALRNKLLQILAWRLFLRVLWQNLLVSITVIVICWYLSLTVLIAWIILVRILAPSPNRVKTLSCCHTQKVIGILSNILGIGWQLLIYTPHLLHLQLHLL
jgi:hypothetical protein